MVCLWWSSPRNQADEVQDRWQFVFLITMAVSLAGLVFFGLLGGVVYLFRG